MSHQQTLNTWLNDAYAMEVGLVELLEDRVDQTADHKELNDQVKKHLEETQGHADKIRKCIERRGDEVSEVKAGISNMMGAMQGMLSGLPADSLVKAGISDYAAEHFEIASYTALATAAREADDEEIAKVAEEIIEEEEAMAEFLANELTKAVKETMAEAKKEDE